jgi:hypothetical protein
MKLSEIVATAQLIVEAIRDDQPNPAVAVESLVAELNRFAIALVQINAERTPWVLSLERQLAAVQADANAQLERYRMNLAQLETIVDAHALVIAARDARIVELEGQLAIAQGAIAVVGVRGALVPSPHRSPVAGEVLPPNQRAWWARDLTEHDE